ncbi:ABC transporter substrate-binding protein [Phytohabitans kaempferiae]|uniref:ABC transporter substrate-binding protein n=1 Tax=Phytohabitans kaempferiae TaxID=1620943 RepID=A0ABV6MA88_9ACTN
MEFSGPLDAEKGSYMRLKGMLPVAVTAALLLSACGDDASTATVPEGGTIKVGIEAPWDLAYVPTSLAIDKMKAKGYTLEAVQFSEPDAMAQALQSGQIDVATNSAGQVLSAIDAGLPVKAFLGLTDPTFVMVAKAELSTCASLNGKRVAVQGQADFIAASTAQWLAKNCPGTKPDIVVIPGSENRAAALLAGQIDASGLHILRFRQLQKEQPGKFVAIDGFGAPEKVTSGWFYAKTEWLDNNKDLVKTFVDAYSETVDDIYANPESIQDRAVQLIPDVDPTLLREVVGEWAELKAWPAKEGVQRDVFDATLTFYKGFTTYKNVSGYEQSIYPPS